MRDDPPKAPRVVAPHGVRRSGVVLGLISVSGPLALSMYVPAFPAIAENLQASPGAVQLSLVSFLAALAIGQNLFGPLSDRFGRKGPLAGGLGLFVVASVAVGLSQNVEHLVGFRFLQGIGACAAMAIPRAIIRDLYTGSGAARSMALIILVASVAPLAAPLAGSGLVEAFGWRSIFYFMAGAGSLGMLLVIFSLPESLAHQDRAPGFDALRGYGSLLRNKLFVCTAMMIGFGQATHFAYLAGSPFVFMNIFGLAAWEYSLIYTLGAVSWTLSAQFAPRLMEILGAERLMSYCILANGLITILVFALSLLGYGNLTLIIVSVMLVFVSLGIMLPTGTVLALHPHGAVAGSASAVIGTTGFLAGALASAVVTALENGTALPMLGTIAGCALLSVAAGAVALRAEPIDSN
jgi:DHA1 family bicyclomycin/chloramphenicol resistance-like MFS transporter